MKMNEKSLKNSGKTYIIIIIILWALDVLSTVESFLCMRNVAICIYRVSKKTKQNKTKQNKTKQTKKNKQTNKKPAITLKGK